MTGIYEFEGWAPRIIRAYHEPPINAFRVLALGLDGSNAVAIKVFPDGALLVTGSSGGSGGGNVTVTGFLPTINALVTVTGFLPSITGIVTVNAGLGNFGGIQYTEGDVDPTITGTAIMFRSTNLSDEIRPVSMELDCGLPVQPGAGVVFAVAVNGPISLFEARSEDGPSDNAQQALPILAVRNDTPSTLTDADLDYSWMAVDDKGRLRVTGDAGMGPLLVTVTGQLSTEALYATHVSTGINLTSTTVWTVAISTPSTHWRHFEFVNTTDTDIQLSFDGGTTKHRTYPAAYAGSLDLKANDLHETGFIAIRNDGAAPTRGKVYVHASGT